MYIPAGGEPRGRYVPPVSEPAGHLFQVGDAQVRQFASAAGEHAEGYVRGSLDPMVDDLRSYARSSIQSEQLFDEARADIEGLRRLVHGLPGTLAQQMSQATSLKQLDSLVVDDPTLHQEINRMQNKYPWLAPLLVRLRHAVSRQAIESNILEPAGNQMGF